MRDIVSKDINYFELTNKDTKKIDTTLKHRILRYLKGGKLGIAGDCAIKDPFTGDIFTRTSVQYMRDGFEWWTMDIYMFEKYDIKLSDDFMALFQ